MFSLSNLHDATLESVNLEWAEGVVHVTFKVHGFRAVVLEAKDLFKMTCPRLGPWGPSNSVNSAEIVALADSQCLTIEMQSGDVLEISCREVSVNPFPD
jgi:hypothetical protein